jgi:hypothetical protein
MGCPYGTNQSPGGTTHNSPEIHFREIFSGKLGCFSGLILAGFSLLQLIALKFISGRKKNDKSLN